MTAGMPGVAVGLAWACKNKQCYLAENKTQPRKTRGSAKPVLSRIDPGLNCLGNYKTVAALTLRTFQSRVGVENYAGDGQ